MIETEQLVVGIDNVRFGWALLAPPSHNANLHSSFLGLRAFFGTPRDHREAERMISARNAEVKRILMRWAGKRYLVACDCFSATDKVRIYKGLFYKEQEISGVCCEEMRETESGGAILIGIVEIDENNVSAAVARAADTFRTFIFLSQTPIAPESMAEVAFRATKMESDLFCMFDFPQIMSSICKDGGWILRTLGGSDVAAAFYGCRTDSKSSKELLGF